MRRHHVHLSSDIETALKVGERYGKPFVFKVKAAEMTAEDYKFYVSANGVWLTEKVPPQFLEIL
jgi:putative RNA 2'-phosphotransferase